jgi:hypothetical protein
MGLKVFIFWQIIAKICHWSKIGHNHKGVFFWKELAILPKIISPIMNSIK